MDLPILIDKKGDNYGSILVISHQLTKIIYYKLVIIIIDVSNLAKVIIYVIVRHYDLSNFIVTNWELLFTSKF